MSPQIYTERRDTQVRGTFGVEGTLIETRCAAATKEGDRLFSSTEQAKNGTRSGFAIEGQGTTDPAINDDAAGAKNAVALTAVGFAHTPAYPLIPAGQTIRMLMRVGTSTADYPVTMRRDSTAIMKLAQ